MSKSEEKHRAWVRFATAKPCLSRVFSDAGTFSTAPHYLHFAIRSIMHEAALALDVDPDRISFVNTVRIIRRKFQRFQTVSPPRLWGKLRQEIIKEIARDLLPPRRLRVNPRVVKRKMSNYALKHRIHRGIPQPSCRISDAVKAIGEALN